MFLQSSDDLMRSRVYSRTNLLSMKRKQKFVLHDSDQLGTGVSEGICFWFALQSR